MLDSSPGGNRGFFCCAAISRSGLSFGGNNASLLPRCRAHADHRSPGFGNSKRFSADQRLRILASSRILVVLWQEKSAHVDLQITTSDCEEQGASGCT